MAVKINEKALEKTRKEIEILAKRDLFGLPANFARNWTRKIIEIYLKNCEVIEAEERQERKKKEEEGFKQMWNDVGWFPGDCCD